MVKLAFVPQMLKPSLAEGGPSGAWRSVVLLSPADGGPFSMIDPVAVVRCLQSN
jgi:hypothetical protein